MELIVPGIVAFIIWILCAGKNYGYGISPTSAPAYNPPVNQESTHASLARQSQRSFREQLEKIKDAELLMKQQNRRDQDTVRKDVRTPKETKVSATWFIGTWGINEPSHAEQLIINELDKYNLKWYREVSFSDLLSPSIGYLRFDFYLPKYQTAIEYQGIGYHSSPERVTSDKLKAMYCKNNDISLHIYEVEHYRNMEKTIADLMSSLHVRLK